MLYPTELRDHMCKIAKRAASDKPQARLDGSAKQALSNPMRRTNPIKYITPFLAALWLSACGQLTLMDAEDEARIGAEQHPLILQEFGGVYDNPKVTAYVEQVLANIMATLEKPAHPYRVTILDSPIVNAFALPGGYTYVTRGLLSLANSEAELAGVIGHEIAHVTARHGARRHTAAVGTAVVAGVLGTVINMTTGVSGQMAGEVLNAGGGLLLAGYSRDNEYEADDLGIEALAMAGYDPSAQADFLAALGAYAKYQSGGVSQKTSWFASHPNNKERVARARRVAQAQKTVAAPRRHGDRHMMAVQGMAFGDGPKQGVVLGRRFSHADLALSFEVPRGFNLKNGKHNVRATHANGVQIIFDLDARIANEPLADYMAGSWAAGAPLGTTRVLQIDGRQAVEGEIETDNGIALLLALDHSETQILRFGVLAPSGQISAARQVMRSLKRRIDFLTAAQIAAIKPLRVNVIKVARGDTLYSLARRMAVPLDSRLPLLRVLNQLEEDAVLRTGQPLKLVVR